MNEAGEKSLKNCFVFLGLAKAFNTINLNIYLFKLKGHKIKDSLMNLFKGYLKNRSLSSVINSIVSEHKTVNERILQDSCLGPLSCFFWEFFLTMEINMKLIADDGCLSYQDSDLNCYENPI